MTTKLSHDGLRKAAILVASLDTAAADAVLDQLTPEQARQVREIVVEIDDIDQGEQRRVIDEFDKTEPGVPAASARRGVEWTAAWPGALPAGAGRARRSRASPLACGRTRPVPPFRFLQESRGRETCPRARQRAAANHRAGALAPVSRACRGRAARDCRRTCRSNVIHRLVDLEETDPEILREVEEALRSRLSQQVEMQRRRVAGLQAVAGILQATDGRAGHADPRQPGEPRPRAGREARSRGAAIDVRRTGRLGRGVLAEVFDEAGPELMLPALFGAAPELVSHVLARIAAGRRPGHPPTNSTIPARSVFATWKKPGGRLRGLPAG